VPLPSRFAMSEVSVIPRICWCCERLIYATYVGLSPFCLEKMFYVLHIQGLDPVGTKINQLNGHIASETTTGEHNLRVRAKLFQPDEKS